MSGSSSNALVSTYRERFGEPFTTDEVYGYWLFVAGTVVAVVGMAAFLTSMGAGRTGTRGIAYLLAGIGLATAFAGLVVGQSFHRTAKRLVYVGLLVCLAAMAWFLTVFPGEWALGSGSAQGVVAVYTLGLALITLSGALAPISVGQSRARQAVEEQLAEARSDDVADDRRIEELEAAVAERDDRIAALESDLSESRAETEEARGATEEARAATEAAREEARAAAEETAAAREETASVRDDLHAAAAHVTALSESSATFDVYRDKAGQWRWRLVHRNGNIVATSGEGYSSDRAARRGMRSVKRNALGAAVVWQRDEEEPEPMVEPVAEEPSARFRLYRDADDEYRWRLRHDNGETIAAATRGFSSRSAAEDGIESVRSAIGPADYLEFDPAGIEVYEDAAGEFRWRLVHRNGNVLGDSGEGYATRSNARRAADRFQEAAGEASVDADSGLRFETYEDAAGDYRWRLVAANGEPIGDSGEGYSSSSELADAVERVRKYAPEADRLTMATAAVEVYEDAGGDYRWRLRHR
ncbi:HVO_2922 family protein, partial [Halobaculum sp. EA56]|uniref:HVO_2922 family protein n=1 Tax=Halobaculum sp. EA56 TaxID=3421648 RepID=UPI003EB8BE8A